MISSIQLSLELAHVGSRGQLPSASDPLSKFSKTEVGKYLAALAPRGDKTKEKDAFFERIEEEGILTRERPRAWVEVQGGTK